MDGSSFSSLQNTVLAIPLPRRPLFPGNIMPVSVQNPKLVKELLELKRTSGQAYVGAFLRVSAVSPQGIEGVLQSESAASSDSNGSAAEAKDADLQTVGTFCQVHHISEMESGNAQMLLLGHRRLKRLHTVAEDPLKVAVEHLRDQPYNPNDDHLKATTLEIVSTLKELLHLHPLYNEQLRSFAAFGGDFHDLSRLADMGASLTSADEAALQGVLEELSVPSRADAVLLLLKKEVELCKLQGEIGKRVEEKISKDQRRYFLMEQLRSIKKELGLEKDDKSALIQRFEERIEPFKDKVPEDVRRVIEEEMAKLSGLEQASSEFNVTRNYLDWLTSLPWGQFSEELLDIEHARRVLDEDHYGLEDVKERVLEFIAVGRLRGSTQGNILCLVGPPGVGKTSVGRSIARALNRKYYRFSVGGLSDVAEIKGHRRTYVGAMPGKMVQCLKSTGTSNPLVLIDEIDKLGRGYQGDPASALLELLDPEQNSSFLDHYLDVPIDLSKVLFMCTANLLDTIPPPLLDRMEVIRIPGYIADEKVHIARQYLEPQSMRESGVPEAAASISDAAMHTLIHEYARESGVRNLKKLLEKIYRKVAFKLVKRQGEQAQTSAAGAPTEGGPELEKADAPPGAEKSGEPETLPAGSAVAEKALNIPLPAAAAESAPLQDSAPDSSPRDVALEGEPVTVEVDELKDYVGQPPFTSDRIYDVTPAGVVMGLAWTAMGGSTLYVEAACVETGDGKGGLRTTGQLGDVMKESANIAHTFARSFAAKHGVPAKFFSDSSIHVHVPAGATPKDGPSAGCTIITALLSLAQNKPVRPDLAMTGEVTLTGRVLPIGGVKEKTLAARRSGVKTLIFPKANQHDFEELADEVKAGFEAHFVETFQEVFDIAFEDSQLENASQEAASAA
ncbi:ATP-dependent protease La [Coccomyxa subellipsoidea C-169]|uniref:Lon protease homolog, mitochondrial n=1 Tax=Coccomyxa subellipsoidea (strain C-169) TaxID=574566 RepID=I0Z147_COCSC|nr:ATP-dependent protease La [Coccomyxa subellipsoidea C-169]EIE24366.1 ATP-dependent protease La [Coccomyxa subellipsoidea C-169]|eukprot:XP_005648910.1 ATP-dependent protease La [Coccomyxa subellipsoidea C-169]